MGYNTNKSMSTKAKLENRKVSQKQIITDLPRPYKVDKYQEFVLWFAMPTYEREKLGIETQKEFAAYYHVNENTLTKWKDRPDFEPRVDHIQMQWGKEKTGDVILGIYRSAIKGNPMSQLLWLQYFKKFSPKTTEEKVVKHEITVNDYRFLINSLPPDLREEHYGYFTKLLIDASAAQRSGLLEDPADSVEAGSGGTGSEDEISDEADNDARDVSREATDGVPGSDQEGVPSDMVREVQSYHNQSAARWRQEQAPGNSRVRSLVLTETEGC